MGYANTRTTWELFSAIVSLGAIYRGHEACAIELINSYLNLTNRYSLESSGHSKGGGLYALGLIYANHGTVINDYLLRLLKEERNEVGGTHNHKSIIKICFLQLYFLHFRL